MITSKDTVIKIKSDNLDGNCDLYIFTKKFIKKAELCVGGKNFSFLGGANELTGAYKIENPLSWSVNVPNLYSYTIKIEYEDGEEIAKGQFAFRTLSTNGKEICVNGTPVYIRGYIRGTTAHDHQNNAHLSEEEFYRKNILATLPQSALPVSQGEHRNPSRGP